MTAADPPRRERSGDEPLVERERELARLSGLLADALAGEARVALIEGQAGIGKSRLLAELRAEAAAADGAARVCTARASELERELPFGVVRQLFEPLLALPGAERWLAGAAASAQPVLTSIPAPPLAGGDDAPQDSSFAALHGLHWLVVNLAAEQPLVLSIDDLHWCDRPSLRFLAYLLRRLEDLPVLVAVTVRASEPGTDPAILGEIAEDPATVSVRPGPLTPAGVRALVQARLNGDDPDFCAACAHVTGGNPLLLRRLLGAFAADGVAATAANAELVHDAGPRAVSRTVLLSLARLPPQAAAVARSVAVLGESAEVRSLGALAELDERAVGVAAGALVRADIVRAELPLAFVHPLVREAVYRELPQAQRERQHWRAAALLRDAGAPAEQVAQQLLAVPPRGEGWVVEHLQEAARSSMRKGAPDSAATYLRRALDEPPEPRQRPQVLLDLGLTEALTAGPDATTRLRSAYEAFSEPAARGQAAVLYARTMLFTGSPRDAGEFAERAAEELPPELVDLRQALAAVAAIAYSSGVADFDEAARALAPYRERRIGDGPGAKMVAAMAGFVWTVTGEIGAAEAVALAREALAGGQLIPYDGNHVGVATIFVLALADDEGAIQTLDTMRAWAHGRGSIFGVMGANLWGGFVLLHRGDLTQAESELRNSLALQTVWQETGIGRAYGLAFLAETLVERGDLAGARAVLAEDDLGPADAEGVRFIRRAGILLALAEGDGERALALLAGYEPREGAALHPTWEPWRTLQARALGLVGRREEAVALHAPELEAARRWGTPGIAGAALRVRGELSGSVEDLRDAVALLAASTRRLEHAKALAALGTLLRGGGGAGTGGGAGGDGGAGGHGADPVPSRGDLPAASGDGGRGDGGRGGSRDREPAREPLRAALALADDCGADGLAERVRAELHASGARPRRSAIEGAAALTASERRVAARAAAGESNREIAQALYVTPKTVEVHLTNAYRKLGIQSRRELAGALDDPPDPVPATTP